MATPLRIIATGLVLGLAAACATPFSADVTRFHSSSLTSGGSFFIQPAGAQSPGGLEFQTYAGEVSRSLEARGFRPATSAAAADYLVTMGFGVDQGQVEIYTTPGFSSRVWTGWGWGRPGFGGWYDPWFGPWGGPFDYPEVRSRIRFQSFVAITMQRTNGPVLFEGRALAESQSRDLTRLVPQLVTALFTDFPGRSGQTVRVTIDSDGRATSRPPRG